MKLTIDTDTTDTIRYLGNVKYLQELARYLLESTTFDSRLALAVQFSILSSQISVSEPLPASPQQYFVRRNKMRKFFGGLRIMIVQTFTLSIRHANLYRARLGIQIQQ